MRLQNSQYPDFCINVNTYIHMYSHNTGEISDMYVCTHSGDRLVWRKLVVYSPLYFFSKILKFVFTCFFWVRHLACGNPSSLSGIELTNHWTTREVSPILFQLRGRKAQL